MKLKKIRTLAELKTLAEKSGGRLEFLSDTTLLLIREHKGKTLIDFFEVRE